jgi:hypothetical protein
MNQEELVLYLSLPYLDDNTLIQACQVNTQEIYDDYVDC